MFLAYGGYVHAPGEVTIGIAKTVVRSAIGKRIGFTETWTIQGVLHAASPGDLTDALSILEAGYSFDGNNIILFNDDGSPTQHAMYSNAAQGGIRIVEFTYPQSDQGQYTTFRNYTIKLEGRFILAGANELVSWVETLSFTGDGGPRFVMQQPLFGIPQKWQVASNTPYVVKQTGTAVMMFNYPNPPGPLFPLAEHRDRRRIDAKGPDIINGIPQNYTRTWSYEFESAFPMFGNPTLPRG